MFLGNELTLYKKDGSPFVARIFSYEKDDECADGLTYEGRLIYCMHDELGVFYFDDTKEQIFEFPPS